MVSSVVVNAKAKHWLIIPRNLAKALSNITALRNAISRSTPPLSAANLNLVSGPGLWAAKPAGGSDSVTPAWRSTYIEYGLSHRLEICYVNLMQHSGRSDMAVPE